MTNLSLFSGVYLMLFGALLAINFILFHWGLFTLLLARGETYKMEKGRRILFSSLLLFLIILFIISAFYLSNYFLRGEENLQPLPEEQGEFPPASHMRSSFPPAP